MSESVLGRIFRRRETSAVAQLLKELPLFSDLTRRELEKVERIAHERSYGPGEAIFHKGDPGVGLYVIRKGTICIVSDQPETILGELSDGDFFGEIAILNETPRSATARAKTACSILAFFKSDLFRIMEDDPALGMRVMSALSRIAGDRLVRANGTIEQLRTRVAALEAGDGESQSPTVGI